MSCPVLRTINENNMVSYLTVMCNLTKEWCDLRLILLTYSLRYQEPFTGYIFDKFCLFVCLFVCLFFSSEYSSKSKLEFAWSLTKSGYSNLKLRKILSIEVHEEVTNFFFYFSIFNAYVLYCFMFLFLHDIDQICCVNCSIFW